MPASSAYMIRLHLPHCQSFPFAVVAYLQICVFYLPAFAFVVADAVFWLLSKQRSEDQKDKHRQDYHVPSASGMRTRSARLVVGR